MVYFVIALIIVLLDQITKVIAVRYLKGHGPYTIVENFFKLHYVENTGAAFGILKDSRIFFIIVSVIVIVFTILFMFKYSATFNKIMMFSLAMFIGGSIGNLIDRVKQGYVVDFLSFKLPFGYDFPVFNLADTFIVISTMMIMFMIFFNKWEI